MANAKMFDTESFDGLNDVSEVKSAVTYFAHNEIKFRDQLASEGRSYEDVKSEITKIWTKLLELCNKYKYSDYIVESKKQIYRTK